MGRQYNKYWFYPSVSLRNGVCRFGENQVINKRYTWRPEYQLPFESQWSCCKKISFLNAETPTASKLFIAQNYSHTKDNSIVDLVTEPRFLNQKIRYCRECIKEYGYHSVLHQSVFFDTCFLHGTPLIQSDIDIHDLHTAAGVEDQYDVEKIVLANKKFDIIIDSITSTVTFDVVDLNLYDTGNFAPSNALKRYVQKQLLNNIRRKSGNGRTILSMSKSELSDASKKVVKELKQYIVGYDDGIEPIIKEKHLEDLLLQDRWRTDGLCPLYLRSVAYRQANNGLEMFYSQCNNLLCGKCDTAALSTEQRIFYSKILLLFWMFGTLNPSKLLKVWGCFQPDRFFINNLSLERLSKWYRFDYEIPVSMKCFIRNSSVSMCVFLFTLSKASHRSLA